MNMITNIAKDISRSIMEDKDLSLILTTGSALNNMFFQESNLKEKDLYLVKLNNNGSLNSYQLLKEANNVN